VEEKDVHLEPEEEDTEAHVNQGMHYEPKEAVNVGREDEGDGDDVEGHVNMGVNIGAPDDAVNVGREDDDDVEGHVNIG
jgi:hypothetical protein